MTRHFIFAVMLGLMPCMATAQNEQDSEQTAQQEQQADTPKHIMFEGLELKGDIYDFAEALQHRGYKLEKRMGNQQYFLFKGMVAGRSCYFQVSYTKKSRTVWRIVAQISHSENVSFVDSVSTRYGEVFDSNERGYQWMQPTGSVMFMTPQQGDPSLIIVDAEGYLTYKEEDVLSQRQR